jgi:hypothetical protein
VPSLPSFGGLLSFNGSASLWSAMFAAEER